MDIFEIAKEFNEHRAELSDAGFSVIMAATDDNDKMCICSTGKFIDQLRCLAVHFVSLRKAFIRNFSKKEWDEVWQRVIAEQTMNLKLNEKMKENENE